ncbi:MAG: AAA family ATPase [Methylocystis sp.]|jgi:hypothetical protein
MNLRQIAHALGGEVSSGQVLAPGPGHSKLDRSLSVRLSPGAPDGFLTFSPAGDDWKACRDYVGGRLGITPERCERPTSKRPTPEPRPGDDNHTRAAARRLFQEAVDARGTLGERYLSEERGLSGVIDDMLAFTLRYHSACPFRDGEQLVRAPALVAALRDRHAAMDACSRLEEMDVVERRFLADPKNILAVQRIRLDSQGRKVERRSLGPLGNGVVFLSSIFEQFDEHLHVEQPAQTSRKMRLEWVNAASALALSEPNNPLIADMFDEGAMSVSYGESNAGKTFVPLDMAMAVATGHPWNGKAVKRGLVVYIAAEGGAAARARALPYPSA